MNFLPNIVCTTLLIVLLVGGGLVPSTLQEEQDSSGQGDDDDDNNKNNAGKSVAEGASADGASSTTATPLWLNEALKDIAYYLRGHKFNEYDRRYETDPKMAKRLYFRHFPRPPLRSLHWEVKKFCEEDFLGCVDYLRRKIRQVTLQRHDDTMEVIREQKWDVRRNEEEIRVVEKECRRLLELEERLGKPFAGPLERFQWRVTASYYMCHYTMLEVSYLEHLGEDCSNFSHCFDNTTIKQGGDWRSNDTISFACSRHSFCPDPCCPLRFSARPDDCWQSRDNPCYASNPPDGRQCQMLAPHNVNFRDVVLNRWNVSCGCGSLGYAWNSLYGMCIDVDECATYGHNCDAKLEACVNTPGSFRCACRWGHVWDPIRKGCVQSPALGLIKLQKVQTTSGSGDGDDDGNGNEAQSIVKWIFQFGWKGKKKTKNA